jgi:hypothetical protein
MDRRPPEDITRCRTITQAAAWDIAYLFLLSSSLLGANRPNLSTPFYQVVKPRASIDRTPAASA